MKIHKISEHIKSPRRDFIYDFLSDIPFQLAVDIGAAAGDVTKRLRNAGDSVAQVVAFEPFPGNFQFFDDSTRGLDHIRLVKKAVSDKLGAEQFLVHSVVQGNEAGWEEFSGYSSVGFLESVAPETKMSLVAKVKRQLGKTLRRLRKVAEKKQPIKKIDVETTTLDFEFPTQTLDFVKIDVQGAEEKVLRGAKGLFQEQRIGVLYIEWSGERPVVDILSSHGYHIYDSTYITQPKEYSVKAFEEIGFGDFHEVNLSTGKIAYTMVLQRGKVSPEEAMGRVAHEDLAWMIQTDLIAVSPRMHEKFIQAIQG